MAKFNPSLPLVNPSLPLIAETPDVKEYPILESRLTYCVGDSVDIYLGDNETTDTLPAGLSITDKTLSGTLTAAFCGTITFNSGTTNSQEVIIVVVDGGKWTPTVFRTQVVDYNISAQEGTYSEVCGVVNFNMRFKRTYRRHYRLDIAPGEPFTIWGGKFYQIAGFNVDGTWTIQMRAYNIPTGASPLSEDTGARWNYTIPDKTFLASMTTDGTNLYVLFCTSTDTNSDPFSAHSNRESYPINPPFSTRTYKIHKFTLSTGVRDTGFEITIPYTVVPAWTSYTMVAF